MENIIYKVPENPEGIIIYCHGLSDNKLTIERYYKKLNQNGIGIVSFDLPGIEEKNSSHFYMGFCIDYLDSVIEEVRKKYSAKIYLLGNSFGGFLVLSKLIRSNDVDGSILMCPEIDFCNIINKQKNISLESFDQCDAVDLYGNVRIIKNSYMDFKQRERLIDYYHYDHMSIITGDADHLVDLSVVENFCHKNHLNLEVVSGGEHELFGHDNDIVNYILRELGVVL